MQKIRYDSINSNKIFALIGAAVIAVLLIPLLAMQITDAVQWGMFDFIFMALLMLFFSTSFVLVARKAGEKRPLLVGFVMLTIFLYTWAEVAVGVFF